MGLQDGGAMQDGGAVREGGGIQEETDTTWIPIPASASGWTAIPEELCLQANETAFAGLKFLKKGHRSSSGHKLLTPKTV